MTGMGILSAIGIGVEANHKSLISHSCGISDISILKTKHQSQLPAGEIKLSNHQLIAGTNFQENEKIPRSVLLSIPAINEALQMADIQEDESLDFYYATTVGGIDISEELISQRENGSSINYNDFKYHDCGASTELLTDYYGFTGNSFTISTACSSSANAIGKAADALKSGKIKYALAGGSDALSRFTLSGFNSLMILDKNLCRPMDDARNGLNLGEGAAFLFLETEENAISRGAEILGYVVGFSNTNDSHHQTASSEDGEGAFLAIRDALKRAQLDSRDISYINAHGTGTQNNDLSEGNALERIFEIMPPVASTKSYTGHTLAASGAIEAVFSLLALKNNEIYPTLRWENKISAHRLHSFNKTKFQEVNYVLSNAFGFGGNCSTLIFGK